MTMTRRKFLSTSAAAAAAGVASSALPWSTAFAADKTVRVGYNTDYAGASVYAIANAKNLWKKHDLVPDLYAFTSGPIQVQAFKSGSLDFGYLGPGALWMPAAGMAKIVAINVVGMADALIGQSGIKKITDLKGKKVGVPQGTSGDLILRLALKKVGMTLQDIEVVYMSPSTVVSAFSAGQIDAAGLWYPLVGIMQKNVPDANTLADDKDFYPEFVFPSVFVARNEVVEKKPELVERTVAVIKDAQDFRHNNPDEAIAMTSSLISVPEAQLKKEATFIKPLTSDQLVDYTKDGTVEGWLSTLNRMFASLGRFEEHPQIDVEDYYMGKMYISA